MAQKYNSLSLYTALVSQEYAIKEAISAAQSATKKASCIGQHPALNLFNELFKQGHGVKEAIEIANNYAHSDDFDKSDDYDKKVLALELLSCLVKETSNSHDLWKNVVESATIAAQCCAHYNSYFDAKFVRRKSLELFIKLVERGHAFKEAFAAGNHPINNTHNLCINTSVILLSLLEEKQLEALGCLKIT